MGSSFAYVEWVPHLHISGSFHACLCRVDSTLAYVERVPRLLMSSGFLAY